MSSAVVGLNAVIVSVGDTAPQVLVVSSGEGWALPSGQLAADDRTLDLALRRYVRDQTALELGYVEQLYTFGDLGRVPDERQRLLSVAYLALTRADEPSSNARWLDCYELLPWEDHRAGRPAVLDELVDPAVNAWADEVGAGEGGEARRQRGDIVFAFHDAPWDGVRVLERYELLYEVGLLTEAPGPSSATTIDSVPMRFDHRRMVATALGRLRGKLTYRPVVFELLPDTFTLLQLQRLVEALAGVALHKQNFRRLVERARLVEGTGDTLQTGGRPAELFRFRREVLTERPRPGVGVPWSL
ncbi:MAG: hypothetical protein OEU32_13140 [Acidimicrobiia bacterium]|nr:hypothetical protein [Acidimicrobiia bacterium]